MLNVNTAIYSAQGIDVNNVAKVASQILKEGQTNAQPQVQAIDYSKFNRASLGIDLYSSRTNSQLQKQIALTQAGLYAQAVNVAQLNSAAAASLYSAAKVAKNVELTQSAQITEFTSPKQLEVETNKIQLFNISDKNSNSSNGFNPFKADEESSNKEESEKDFNLFA
ncbi:MAG: hypothetical protein IKL52_03585 [Candidatus Gastranaerophilales bacterium]|jgi:hypothetical protein|nr:hypothetical protein [Candidatus Gastranaerophilales bacterium]